MRLSSLLFALTACGPAPVGVYVQDTRKALDPSTVTDACEIISQECVPVDDPHGAISIVLVDHTAAAPGFEGRTLAGRTFLRPCRPIVWAVGDPVVLAHELGHALGLGHVSDPHRLMYHISGGTEVTQHEQNVMDRHALWLSDCVGGP